MKNVAAIFLSLLFFSCQTTTEKKDPAGLLSPEEAIADFEIEKGFEVQPVASEPLVEDPVALRFDADGAMWVIEMRGYMQDEDGRGEDQPLGRIKILKDANNDGRYESASIFLDSLIMPRAVLPVHGGALVIEPPKLYFVENSNGHAGRKTVIDSAFAEGGNTEHQPNGLMPAMDNWIYCAKSNKRVRFRNGAWVVEKTQFRGQWGLSQDDWGRLFYNDNSTTLMGDNFLPNAFGVNEQYNLQSKKAYNIQLVSNRVFPSRRTPGVNRGYEKGTLDSTGKLVNVTAACGPVVYRGDNFPEAYYGNAFVMEPSAYLMKRIRLFTDSNNQVHGAFAYEKKEFLTASDERFRPVNAFNAPDGSLFFIDMHRGVIQHTTYLTPYLRHYIDSLKLQRPIGMGRIYRIKWKEKALSKKVALSNRSSAELVTFLKHKSGWYRDMAQRLLVERQDTGIVSPLQTLVAEGNPITTLHALYTLEGLQALSPKFLLQTAQHTSNNFVYTTCMKLLEAFPKSTEAFSALQTLAAKNGSAALQFVNSLPHFEAAFPGDVKKALLEQLTKHQTDTLFTDAIISGAMGKEAARLSWFSSTDTTLRKALQTVIVRKEQATKNPTAHMGKRDAELYYAGEKTFKTYCATCHGATGDGLANVAPPLAGSEWVLHKDKTVPTRILLDGLGGAITVAGKQYAPPSYSGTMPALRNNIETNNGTLAAVLTYVRNAWGNKASAVTVQEVAAVRQATANRQQPYTAAELQAKK